MSELKFLDLDEVAVVHLDESELTDLEKSISDEMRAKYPNGRWVTMRGRHVYIKENGEIAPETDPRSGGSAHAGADRLYDADPKKLQVGDLYKYGKQTVTIEKIGRSYVHIRDNNDKVTKVPKSKFLAKVKVSEGGSVNEGQKEVSLPEQAQQAPQEAPQDQQATGGTKVAGELADGAPPAVPDGTSDKKPATDTGSQGAGSDVEAAPEGGQPPKETPANDSPLGSAGSAGASATGDPMAMGAHMPRVDITTAKNFKSKNLSLEDDPSGDDVYDLYQKWKRDRNGKAYFEIKMVQFADLTPEQKQRYGLSMKALKVGNEVAGLAVYRDHGDSLELHYAEIAPSMRRGQGYGSMLLAQAIAESYARGYDGKIWLESHADAVKFYKKIGMTFLGGSHNQFEFEPKKAKEFYKLVTGEELGGDSKLNKSLDDAEPKRPQRSGGLTWEELVKAEDELMAGFCVGNIMDRIMSYTSPRYQRKDIDFEEGGMASGAKVRFGTDEIPE